MLRFAYALQRATRASAFGNLLSTASVTVEGAEAIQSAIDWYQAGMDFADALHLCSSMGAERFLTFDKKLARAAARARAAVKMQVA